MGERRRKKCGGVFNIGDKESLQALMKLKEGGNVVLDVEKREEDGHYYHRSCKGEFIAGRNALRCDICKTVAKKVNCKKVELFSSKEPIRRCVGLFDLDDDEMVESFESMSDEFKERTKIVYSNLDDSGNSNGDVGVKEGVKMEEENNEIGNTKRRSGEDGENLVARGNARNGDENGTV